MKLRRQKSDYLLRPPTQVSVAPELWEGSLAPEPPLTPHPCGPAGYGVTVKPAPGHVLLPVAGPPSSKMSFQFSRATLCALDSTVFSSVYNSLFLLSAISIPLTPVSLIFGREDKRHACDSPAGIPCGCLLISLLPAGLRPWPAVQPCRVTAACLASHACPGTWQSFPLHTRRSCQGSQ